MAQNATFIKLKIDGDVLIGEISSSIGSTVDIIDASSKASGRAREILPGRVGENISFESLADDTNVADYGYGTAYAAMAAGTKIDFELVRVDETDTQIDPSQQITGSGYISSLTLDNPDNDRSTMSGTIEIDDEATVETYPVPVIPPA